MFTSPEEIQRQRLLDLLRQEIKHAEPGQSFTLASGATSDWYLDCRPVIFGHVAMVSAVVYNFAVAPLHGLAIDEAAGFVIGGPVLSAIPIVSGIGVRTGLRTFAVRPAPKDHGADASVLVGPLKAGDWCVVVDDVYTSGGSLRCACVAAIQHGAEVVGAVTLVHRGLPGEEGPPPDFLRFLDARGEPLQVPHQSIFTKQDLGVS